MNVTWRPRWTLQQFLAWEEQQPLRYEFDGIQPVAMTGGTAAHDAIKMNLGAALVSRLRGKPCRPHGSDLKIEVAGRVRYPDAFVVCAPIDPKDTVAREPVVVFEVLSEGTSDIDLLIKNQEYRATPSIQRYVILEQTIAGALVFARRNDDWISEIVSGADAVLCFPEIDIEIPLADLYEGVKLSEQVVENGETVEATDRGT